MVDYPLLLDCGNTRIKYRHQETTGVLTTENELHLLLTRIGVKEVIVADVAGKYSSINKMCESLKVPCSQCTVEDGFLGLQIAYSDASTLGVDRWLTMLAARELDSGSGLIVVDAGTAIKLDVIDDRGVHLGGSISPGLQLSSHALHMATNRLPEVDFEFDGRLGVNTNGCIKFGIVISVIALIERAMLQFPRSSVLLTGGDATVLQKHLKFHAEIHSDLVLAGLDLYTRTKNLKSWGKK